MEVVMSKKYKSNSQSSFLGENYALIPLLFVMYIVTWLLTKHLPLPLPLLAAFGCQIALALPAGIPGTDCNAPP